MHWDTGEVKVSSEKRACSAFRSACSEGRVVSGPQREEQKHCGQALGALSRVSDADQFVFIQSLWILHKQEQRGQDPGSWSRISDLNSFIFM